MEPTVSSRTHDPYKRYTRYDLLGQGAQKKVYKAFDEEEGIEVAWNIVSVQELSGASEKEKQRMLAEIRVLQQLKHKNIMSLFDWWMDDKLGTLNFITELFHDGTLRQYRRKHRHVDVNVIKRWAWQILQGLVYLHGHNPPIIHRDLKCDNIFVQGSSGTLKIGDLGLATLQRGIGAAMSVIGTPEFMAPELYEETYDEKVDVYSFGMCLLELFTLEYPYAECKNAAQIYKKVTQGIPPAGLANVAQPEFQEFIKLCILPNPKDRPEARQLLKHPFFDPIRPCMPGQMANGPTPRSSSTGGQPGEERFGNASGRMSGGGGTGLSPPRGEGSLSGLRGESSFTGCMGGIAASVSGRSSGAGAAPEDAPAQNTSPSLSTTSTPMPGTAAIGVAPAPLPMHHAATMGSSSVASSSGWMPGSMSPAQDSLAGSLAPGGDSVSSGVGQLSPSPLSSGPGSSPGVVRSPNGPARTISGGIAAALAAASKESSPPNAPNGLAASASAPPSQQQQLVKAEPPQPFSMVQAASVADGAAAIAAPVQRQVAPEARHESPFKAASSAQTDDADDEAPQRGGQRPIGSGTGRHGSGNGIDNMHATFRNSHLNVIDEDNEMHEGDILFEGPMSGDGEDDNATDDGEHEIELEGTGSGLSIGISAPVNLAARQSSQINTGNMALSFAMSFTSHKGIRKKVGFQYDPRCDTANEIAREMVENLSLNVREAEAIAAMIDHEVKRLNQKKSGDGDDDHDHVGLDASQVGT